MEMRGMFGKLCGNRTPGRRTFMGSLANDTRGNVLAIMAASLIPFCGLVGGGLDLSRMYLAKTRLQHACDAGVLAGRKQMGAGTWGQDDADAARQFFDANFTKEGMYGSNAPTVKFTENGGKVVGNASAVLPMTLTRVLGKTQQALAVTCDADMRLPNTDIMFVLDTTGSMADVPNGDSTTKMASLKVAVKCFYEIVARLDTDATCTTGAPSGGTGNQVQIRFGFVPYATNVNVGRLLKPEWFADSAPYQTREALPPKPVTNTTSPEVIATEYRNKNPRNDWSTIDYRDNVSRSRCESQSAPSDSGFNSTKPEGEPVERTSSGTNPRTDTWATYQYGYYYTYRIFYYGGTNSRCGLDRSPVYADLRRTYRTTTTVTMAFGGWRYAPLPVNVGLLKDGTGWKNSFEWPIGSGGSNSTITWEGCIEERETVSRSSYSPIPKEAKDLDIDSVPTAGDPTTMWRPVLPGLIYTRSDGNGWTTNEVQSEDDMGRRFYYVCPRPSKQLQAWPDPNAFDDYVDTLYPEGNTYHDIGLLWGARLMSPTGIFASANALTPQGGEIDRHMIFMTDGDPCTGTDNYTAYGVNWFDRRTTDKASAPTQGCTVTGTLTEQVNARTEALCSAIKNKNITLWVVTFGSVDSRTVTRLTACATKNRYYSANNAATLQSTFQTIANQISQLRLTK